MVRRRSKSSGVTLIEVMVVIVIMAAVAVAAGINVLKSMDTARRNDTEVRARTIQHAAAAYIMDKPGACPEANDLSAYLDTTTDHNDAWGNAFRIGCDGHTIHVRSSGPDGTHETEDDIGF